jgi:hypothetical protein
MMAAGAWSAVAWTWDKQQEWSRIRDGVGRALQWITGQTGGGAWSARQVRAADRRGRNAEKKSIAVDSRGKVVRPGAGRSLSVDWSAKARESASNEIILSHQINRSQPGRCQMRRARILSGPRAGAVVLSQLSDAVCTRRPQYCLWATRRFTDAPTRQNNHPPAGRLCR